MSESTRRAYRRTLSRLYALEPRGIRLELDRVRSALTLVGHPEVATRFVHVGGTNGKGSVATYIARSLSEAGYRTGLYTSPHLHRFVERIRVDGRPISESAVVRLAGQLTVALSGPAAPPLTFFELTTLLAFAWFAERRVDVAVLEVGLGGRFDATNVVDKELAVVTGVALDHESRLGSTIAAIAREKAGIFAAGRPAIIGARHPAARRVLMSEAKRRGARPLAIGDHFDVVFPPATSPRARRERGPAIEAIELAGSNNRVDAHRKGSASARPRAQKLGRVDVRVRRRLVSNLRPSLAGDYQANNVAIAVAALEMLRRQRGFGELDDDTIRAGIAGARWPGRLELIRGAPSVLLDAAHNPDGCAALARHVAQMGVRGPKVLLFGAMRDKKLDRMLAALDPVIDRRVYATPRLMRAAPIETLAEIRSGQIASSVRQGLFRARRLAGPSGLVVVAGSIFLMSEVRSILRDVRSDPLIAM